jgi:hypothetical protein
MRLCRVGAPFVVFLVAISMQGAETSKPVSPSFARTPQGLARGKYLAELAHCFDCHSERDTKGNQVPGMKGAGRVLPPEESNIPRPHFLVCPNITPDRETGAGSWSDLQLARLFARGSATMGGFLTKRCPIGTFVI